MKYNELTRDQQRALMALLYERMDGCDLYDFFCHYSEQEYEKDNTDISDDLEMLGISVEELRE